MVRNKIDDDYQHRVPKNVRRREIYIFLILNKGEQSLTLVRQEAELALYWFLSTVVTSAEEFPRIVRIVLV